MKWSPDWDNTCVSSVIHWSSSRSRKRRPAAVNCKHRRTALGPIHPIPDPWPWMNNFLEQGYGWVFLLFGQYYRSSSLARKHEATQYNTAGLIRQGKNMAAPMHRDTAHEKVVSCQCKMIALARRACRLKQRSRQFENLHPHDLRIDSHLKILTFSFFLAREKNNCSHESWKVPPPNVKKTVRTANAGLAATLILSPNQQRVPKCLWP